VVRLLLDGRGRTVREQKIEVSCDVAGCRTAHAFVASAAEAEAAGWGIGCGYTDATGVARSYDLCPAHKARFDRVRAAQDAVIDRMIGAK